MYINFWTKIVKILKNVVKFDDFCIAQIFGSKDLLID